jgi:hypothetical protein
MIKSLNWLLLPLVISPVFAIAPMLERLEPRGAQRGKAVKLTLIGTGLTSDTEILTTLPGGITALTPSKRPEAGLPFLLELPSDAAIDTYPIRIRTKDGLSNALLFTIGAFPETIEFESDPELDVLPNDSIGTAQSIPTPITVNGNLEAGDRDYYRIETKVGNRLVVEIEARRLGSAVDPILRVMDVEGNTVARSEDTLGLGVDARVEVSFDKEGPYFVEVHETKFSTLEENFYRLKIGDFSYVDGFFPLGWQRRSEVEVELFGGNLTGRKTLHPELGKVDKEARSVRIQIPGKPGALPISFTVGMDPETLEPRKVHGRSLSPGILVNGRITETGEVDRYALAVNPEETWRLEVDSASLDTSSLYALLTLYNGQGVKLASAGDNPPRENVYEVVSGMDPGEDPFVVLKIPEGTHTLTITVEDLLGRGGQRFGYRLLAKKERGDFELSTATPYINIPERGTAQFSVIANRRGYRGAIKIYIPNLPNDIEMDGGNIAPVNPEDEGGLLRRSAIVTLTPQPGAQAGLLNLEIWGSGELENGRIFRRHALSPVLISVTSATDFFHDFDAPIMDTTLAATVVPEEPAVLEILTPRFVQLVMGQGHQVSWIFHARQSGIEPPEKVDVQLGIGVFVTRGNQKKYATEGTFDVLVSESADLGTNFSDLPMRFDMLVSGKIEVAGIERLVYAPAITFEIVPGYDVRLPTEITLSAGETKVLTGSVTHELGFTSPISISFSGLPNGVTCQQITVTKATQFELACKADQKVELGHHDVQITTSTTSSKSSAGRKQTPLRIKPIEAKLSIEKSSNAVTSAL